MFKEQGVSFTCKDLEIDARIGKTFDMRCNAATHLQVWRKQGDLLHVRSISSLTRSLVIVHLWLRSSLTVARSRHSVEKSINKNIYTFLPNLVSKITVTSWICWFYVSIALSPTSNDFCTSNPRSRTRIIGVSSHGLSLGSHWTSMLDATSCCTGYRPTLYVWLAPSSDDVWCLMHKVHNILRSERNISFKTYM